MNIKVTKEDYVATNKTGGAYATQDLNIYVGKELDLVEQQECVLHEIIEAYCPMWSHDKYDELVDLLMEGLEQL